MGERLDHHMMRLDEAARRISEIEDNTTYVQKRLDEECLDDEESHLFLLSVFFDLSSDLVFELAVKDNLDLSHPLILIGTNLGACVMEQSLTSTP
ncbi:hypothetical protein NDU88_003723 [Pleurodeles waltl]|uniref:Uncharacterized protein n=1 Tax=Pleurodeles waltl TaxID=8319 RepID=A0AAV7UZA4_PLEWA|nr:hypothetical protein NDU88_003723 [Pleurodeles waltl]